MSPPPKRIRKPIQLYLDRNDRALLDAAARPGSSLTALVGALDTSPGVPADLAARHDEYLYP